MTNGLLDLLIGDWMDGWMNEWWGGVLVDGWMDKLIDWCGKRRLDV